VFLSEFTSPYSLNTQRGWHSSERRITKTRHNTQGQQFYPTPKYATNIKFTKEEMYSLNHGLQYSMDRPLKTYWTDLTVETEKPTKLLDTQLQNSYHIMATNKMRQNFNSDTV